MFIKVVLKRVTAAVIMYIIALFMYALLFSAQVDKTIDSQIREQVKGEVIQLLKTNPRADVHTFTNEKTEYYKELYEVKKPLMIKVLKRTWRAFIMDFGNATTIRANDGTKSVKSILLEAMPLTLSLFVGSSIIITLIAVWMGIKKAQKPGKRFDRSTSMITMALFGMPSWWIGMLFIMYFGYSLKWFPTGGRQSVPPPEGAVATALDFLHHLSLPMIVLVVIGFWGTALIIRNIVLGTMQEDFIMAARARGIGENSVMFKHTMRTAAPPITTMALLGILGSFGGSLIFESIFSWPGMGNLYIIATQQNDVPVLMGNVALTTALYMAGLVILDLVYGFLDPRIKVGGK